MATVTVSGYDFTNVQAAVNSASDYDTVVLPSGAYVDNTGMGAVVVGKPLRIIGYGATLCQTGTGKGGLSITACDVSVEGLTMVGRQNSTGVGGENAISTEGADRLKLVDLKIRQWGYVGLWISRSDRFVIRDCEISFVARAAMTLLSCRYGTIDGNYIHDVTQGDNQVNSYGIQLTRYQNLDMAASCRSGYITVSNNVIDGVPLWEGIDTHAGEHITVVGNTVRNCKVGIAIVGCPDVEGQDAYGPKFVTVIGNTINSGVTDGSRDAGIQFVGPTPWGVGSSPDFGTGSIVGNTIIGHGRQSNSLSGAIQFYGTRNLVVSGNTIEFAGNAGILAYHTNIGYNINGNSITDVWSTSLNDAVGIWTRGQFNQGFMGSNLIQTSGTVVTTAVLTYGILTYNYSNVSTSHGFDRIRVGNGQKVFEGLQSSSECHTPGKNVIMGATTLLHSI